VRAGRPEVTPSQAGPQISERRSGDASAEQPDCARAGDRAGCVMDMPHNSQALSQRWRAPASRAAECTNARDAGARKRQGVVARAATPRLVALRACAYCLVRSAMATGADTPLISTTAQAMCARPSANTAQPSLVVRVTAS